VFCLIASIISVCGDVAVNCHRLGFLGSQRKDTFEDLLRKIIGIVCECEWHFKSAKLCPEAQENLCLNGPDRKKGNYPYLIRGPKPWRASQPAITLGASPWAILSSPPPKRSTGVARIS
jgi:hypothetical protein